MTGQHDYRTLIGVPFKKGGRGPDAYDCYGLVRELMKRDGKDVPDYASPEGNAQCMAAIATGIQSWRKTEAKPGVMVVFKLPLTLHCGYVIDDRFIHCWQWSSGVCIERLDQWKHRILGFYEHD